ncbi:MAG TPA: YciI family protein [Chryseolinea sp.]|nr:YciI family protein [Chryseolinea sp.]
MERFMLIIREDLKRLGCESNEARIANIPEMLKWVESMADSGNFVTGEPLAIAGKYVTKDAVLSDGPFIESKEGVSGYDIIEAASLEQAVSIAQLCPLVVSGHAVIEVRPMLTLPEYLVFKWKESNA